MRLLYIYRTQWSYVTTNAFQHQLLQRLANSW